MQNHLETHLDKYKAQYGVLLFLYSVILTKVMYCNELCILVAVRKHAKKKKLSPMSLAVNVMTRVIPVHMPFCVASVSNSGDSIVCVCVCVYLAILICDIKLKVSSVLYLVYHITGSVLL